MFGPPVNGDGPTVHGFNDIGEFVGAADFPDKGKKTYLAAYRHDGSGYFEVVKGGSAYDVNNDGDAVGLYANQSFVYLEGAQELVNLDDAVVGTQAELDLWFDSRPHAYFINDSGVISGELDGGTYAAPLFILDPVEAP